MTQTNCPIFIRIAETGETIACSRPANHSGDHVLLPNDADNKSARTEQTNTTTEDTNQGELPFEEFIRKSAPGASEFLAGVKPEVVLTAVPVLLTALDSLLGPDRRKQ